MTVSRAYDKQMRTGLSQLSKGLAKLCGLIAMMMALTTGAAHAQTVERLPIDVIDYRTFRMNGATYQAAYLYVPDNVMRAEGTYRDTVKRQLTAHLSHDRLNMQPVMKDRHGVQHVMLGAFQKSQLMHGFAACFAPELGEYPSELRQAQAKAKPKGGIWAQIDTINALRLAELWPNFRRENVDGKWMVVRGTITDIALRKNMMYINFGEDWKTDFTLFVPTTHKKHFPKTWRDQMIGKTVEVMGFVYHSYGPMIDITHPSQLTVMEE